MTVALLMGSGAKAAAPEDDFEYTNERFADLQMLRYKVHGFEQLSLRDKQLVYYLSEASLCGRDILFDQNGAYNLRIRKMLETVYTDYQGSRQSDDFKAMEVYLKRVWFSNGIHHHYGCEKFVPGFSEAFFRNALKSVDAKKLPLAKGQTVDQLCDEVFPVIFDPTLMKMRVNQKDGEDLIKTSASNYYGDGVTQAEAEAFYDAQKDTTDQEPVMYGLNSRLVKKGGKYIVQSRRRPSTNSSNTIRPATSALSTPIASSGSRTPRASSISPTASSRATATPSASRPAGKPSPISRISKPPSVPRSSAPTLSGLRTTRPLIRALRRTSARASLLR